MTNPPFPTEAATLLLQGDAGALELACAVPDPALARAGVAVICHPHPLQGGGGSMTNKVVTTLERSLLDLGLATVRFNFRGVGRSEGVHDDGVGETDDLIRIARWAREQRPGDALWLAGFSFGSYVAMRGAEALDPAQMILVAPPAGRWDFARLAAPRCPWLIVQGEADEVVDPAAVYAWAATLQPAPTVVRLPDTGHFFHRRLLELRDAVKAQLADRLPPLRAA
ncbi:alpha/beta hydrolase [Dokdonella ginsengisoli]|uniref:Alpha/beta hydrolase n=1 Tax=Dokdonella ginsengisoli TaxID=363846 RepID=A0ABV9QTQ9_9GAMM